MDIDASIVGAQLISLMIAHILSVKTRAKALIRTTTTREEGRLFWSGKGVSTSPLVQNFLREHH